MTREQKIETLMDIQAGRATIADFEVLPNIIFIMFEVDGYYHCSDIPKSWGYPEQLDETQVKALQERINQYSERRKGLGLPEPIIMCFHPPDPRNEPIKD